MKTKRTPVAKKAEGSALSKKKPRRRGPVFPISAREVIDRCRRLGRPLICARLVLAVREAMIRQHWTTLELSERSKIPRSTISEFLNLSTVPAVNIPFDLGDSLGLTDMELVLLGRFAMRSELPE